MRAAITIVVMAGCSQFGEGAEPYDEMDDAWTSTREVCNPPEPFVRQYFPAEGLSSTCRHALMVDLGVDESSFESTGGDEALDQLIEGAYQLLGRDAGSAADWAEDVYVHAPFLDEMGRVGDAAGGDEGARLLYDFVTFFVGSTTYLGPENSSSMAFDWDTGELAVGWWLSMDGLRYATALVHLTTHARYRDGHVDCPDPDDGERCDDGWDGPNGFQAASAELWRSHLSEQDDWYEVWDERAEEVAVGAAARVIGQ